MTQLTKEQINVWRKKLREHGLSAFAADAAISEVQQELMPLPSYGEVFQNARSFEYNTRHGHGCTDWSGLGENHKSAILAGLEAYRRAFIEREIKPHYDIIYTPSGAMKKTLSGIDAEKILWGIFKLVEELK